MAKASATIGLVASPFASASVTAFSVKPSATEADSPLSGAAIPRWARQPISR